MESNQRRAHVCVNIENLIAARAYLTKYILRDCLTDDSRKAYDELDRAFMNVISVMSSDSELFLDYKGSASLD